jgi:hypothetical protein
VRIRIDGERARRRPQQVGRPSRASVVGTLLGLVVLVGWVAGTDAAQSRSANAGCPFLADGSAHQAIDPPSPWGTTLTSTNEIAVGARGIWCRGVNFCSAGPGKCPVVFRTLDLWLFPFANVTSLQAKGILGKLADDDFCSKAEGEGTPNYVKACADFDAAERIDPKNVKAKLFLLYRSLDALGDVTKFDVRGNPAFQVESSLPVIRGSHVYVYLEKSRRLLHVECRDYKAPGDQFTLCSLKAARSAVYELRKLGLAGTD